MAEPMNIVYFGSGAFGLPTLRHLAIARGEDFRVRAIVTQPDRPAGRGRKLTPTPIAQWAAEALPDVPLLKTADANDPDIVQHVRAADPDALLVIAFGQKLNANLHDDFFAINLHGSLLPKYRGAAPINHAIMNNERETGVTVITLANRMDAGAMLGRAVVTIRPDDTAATLHDRLAELGPDVVERVLRARIDNRLEFLEQDDDQATKAPKLRKEDGTVSFDQPCENVRARIHGLNPWPGCTLRIENQHGQDHEEAIVKIGLVRDDPRVEHDASPGTVLEDHTVACASGVIEIRRIQPPGKRMMDFQSYLNAHPFEPGAILRPANFNSA